MQPNINKKLSIDVDAVLYDRLPIKTHLITPKDNLSELIKKYVSPHLIDGDYIFISEQIVGITQNRIIHRNDVKPSSFAKFLSSQIENHLGTEKFRGYGLGTAFAMQLAIEEVGLPRIVLGAILGAITKPFGIKGMFYRVVGKRAKAIDYPASYKLKPYDEYATLSPLDPDKIARLIEKETNHETVIIDANYQGVVTLGRSNSSISNHFTEEVFRDNPLGQDDEQTPLCIVRRSSK
jgi:hypothetical protein